MCRPSRRSKRAEEPHSAAAGSTLSRLDCHTDIGGNEIYRPPAQLQEVEWLQTLARSCRHACLPCDYTVKAAQSVMAGSCIADLLIILIGGNRLLRVLMAQVADAAPDAPAH